MPTPITLGAGRGAELRKSHLSPPRRRLIELMQSINFGRLENLRVRGGEPVLSDPDVVIVREIKFAGQNGARA